MPHIRANGVELHFETEGDGDRVVLTHGAWTDGRTWRAVAARLKSDFEVVTWDRRGHSRSGDEDGPGSYRQDAADLAALIEGLGDTPVRLVGNSAGGTVTIQMVAQRPDLVRSAAVHEPGPIGLIGESGDPHLRRVLEEEMQQAAEVEEIIARGEFRLAAEHFVDQVAVGPGAWAEFPDEIRDIMVANASTVADDLRDAWDPGSVDLAALAASEVPLMISVGTESPESERAAAQELASRLTRARLVEMPGAGHIPHRTHVDPYVSLLTGFFGSA